MEYFLIIELVIELIAKCLENRDRSSIVNGIMNPGLLEVISLIKVLRKRGFKGRKLREKARECLDYLSSMDSSDIGNIVSEAEAFNEEG